MSDKIDHFCDAMRDNLNAVEAQIERLKSDIGTAQKDTVEGFERKLAEAQAAVTSQRNGVDAAGIRVRHWVTANREAGAAVIQGWKDKVDTGKLELHADQAEESAKSSVVIAEAALADAMLATYEAIAARHQANLAATN
ncbi:hypothetical protein EUV02_02245 [Polymorphobacter arshaanensis]|uniref:Uncharacterized protein n=1 Tax=Glacieibacterium arshaanense TaxID=2511025 RepID=A0A4Y9EQH3_9SPHN|nr:hypothetical protein [Polymorphobacter arshaanensis]TFU05867.1 hypothetical protein EUV02_02245 [Polymorphobacter arshaanensis]